MAARRSRVTAAVERGAAERTVRTGFLLVPLAFYGATVSRTPGWADAPLVAGMVHQLELGTWVNNHNLFILLGHLWLRVLGGVLEPHLALNLLCALLGALTVHGIFHVGLRLTGDLVASALGAVALMLSHSLWWHSTMLEVYTLNTALIAAMLLFLLRFDRGRRLVDLCGAVFCLGLGCSNHAVMGLFGLGFLAVAFRAEVRRAVLRPRALALLAGAFLLGFQLYVWVFAAEFVQRSGAGEPGGAAALLGRMLDETSGGEFRQFMFPEVGAGERLFWAAFYLALLFYNFPFLALLLGGAGGVALLRERGGGVTRPFLALSLAAQAVWSANYLVWDMYAFALPVYVLFGVLVILGIARIRSRPGWMRTALHAAAPTLLLPPLLYQRVPGWIAESEAATAALRAIPQLEQARPFLDPLAYFLDPDKRGYDRVERFAGALLEGLPPHACYWGDEAGLVYPLKYYYQEVLGRRADVDYGVIFGMTESRAEYLQHALGVLRQLERGCPVYFGSLAPPERHVLDLVYAALDGRTGPDAVARMPEAELVASFPRFRLERVPLGGEDAAHVHRLVPRMAAHGD
jgi:hypothetical protein